MENENLQTLSNHPIKMAVKEVKYACAKSSSPELLIEIDINFAVSIKMSDSAKITNI